MNLSKKQRAIVDVLHNGGFIWRAGMSYYLAKVDGHMLNGEPRFRSESVNVRTIRAMELHLESYDSDRGGKRWRLR